MSTASPDFHYQPPPTSQEIAPSAPHPKSANTAGFKGAVPSPISPSSEGTAKLQVSATDLKGRMTDLENRLHLNQNLLAGNMKFEEVQNEFNKLKGQQISTTQVSLAKTIGQGRLLPRLIELERKLDELEKLSKEDESSADELSRSSSFSDISNDTESIQVSRSNTDIQLELQARPDLSDIESSMLSEIAVLQGQIAPESSVASETVEISSEEPSPLSSRSGSAASSPATSRSGSQEGVVLLEGRTGLEYLQSTMAPIDVDPYIDRQTNPEGKQAGQLTVIRPKQRGVEPGFEGRKVWKESVSPEEAVQGKRSDTQKMDDRTHKFHELALVWLQANFEDNPAKLSRLVEELQNPNAKLSDILKREKVFKHACDYIENNAHKFVKNHIVKLHYANAEKKPSLLPRQNAVMVIPFEPLSARKTMVKGSTIINYAALVGFQYGKRTTQVKLNESAIQESLANCAYQQGGCESQKLSLLPSVNNLDGHLNFLLDSTEVRGEHDEECFLIGGQQGVNLQDGVLNKNGIEIENSPGQKKLFRFEESELARMGWLMKLFGDRDKVGSTGANLMYYIDNKTGQARLMNIDPGKAFTEHMDDKGDLTPSGQLLHGDSYPNITVLEDNNLLTKVEEFEKLQASMRKVFGTFDQYIDYFGSKDYRDRYVECAANHIRKIAGREPTNEEMAQLEKQAQTESHNYVKSLRETKRRLGSRYEEFKAVMQPRIDLKNSSPDGPVAVILLDNVEKLTSATVFSERHIHLQTNPKTRLSWDARKVGDQFRYSFEANSESQAKKVGHDLVTFLSRSEDGKHYAELIKVEGNRVILNVPEDELLQFTAMMEEKNIIKYKQQNTFSANLLRNITKLTSPTLMAKSGYRLETNPKTSLKWEIRKEGSNFSYSVQAGSAAQAQKVHQELISCLCMTEKGATYANRVKVVGNRVVLQIPEEELSKFNAVLDERQIIKYKTSLHWNAPVKVGDYFPNYRYSCAAESKSQAQKVKDEVVAFLSRSEKSAPFAKSVHIWENQVILDVPEALYPAFKLIMEENYAIIHKPST